MPVSGSVELKVPTVVPAATFSSTAVGATVSAVGAWLPTLMVTVAMLESPPPTTSLTM